jgi:hypothetical protein
MHWFMSFPLSGLTRVSCDSIRSGFSEPLSADWSIGGSPTPVFLSSPVCKGRELMLSLVLNTKEISSLFASVLPTVAACTSTWRCLGTSLAAITAPRAVFESMLATSSGSSTQIGTS